jgi:GYF domain 2
MATQWFCKIMGDEQGPMTAVELHQLARSGGLAIDDLVRKHADGIWVRAENVIGLFDRPSLPVVVKESIAVIDDLAAVAASWQSTTSLTGPEGQRCSLEVQTQSRTSGSWSSASKSRERSRATGSQMSSVVVPRRTLKVGAGASARAVAQKLANQSTQVACFNSLADTVPSTSGTCGAKAMAGDHGKHATAIGGMNTESQQLVGQL